jgi:hypothetical protein
VFYSDVMTVEMCKQDCSGAGYLYAGVEYSREVGQIFYQRNILCAFANSLKVLVRKFYYYRISQGRG